MQMRFVLAMIAATLGASLSAYGAPGGGMQNGNFRSINDLVSGIANTANGPTGFYAKAYDDSSGVALGEISVWWDNLNTGTFTLIQCTGPAWAHVISVNPGSGSVNINATLNPGDLSCGGFVGTPLVVNLSGLANGSVHQSDSGSGKAELQGDGVYMYTFQVDYFSDTFTGTNGIFSGTFDGSASASRNNNRQKVQ